MRSLCFETTLPRSSSLSARVSRGLVCATAVLAAFAAGCGEDDDGDGDGGGSIAEAESAELQPLTTDTIGIPTTVAVAGGVAWVVESQFDRYVPFGGTGAPSPFRLIGVSLGNGSYDEIPLPNDFFPEGIAATRGGRLFVGSVATGAIVRIDDGSAVAQSFVTSLPPSTVGMTVDLDGRTLWVCSSDTTAGTGTVLGIDIATGETVSTHPLEASANGAFCNDMVQNPADGSLWVTESFGGRIFRIDGDDLTDDDSAEIWLEDEQLAPPEPGQFGVNGITLLDGQLFVVVTDRGTLLSIDPSLEGPTGDDLRELSLSLDGDDGVELVRPDGITAVPGSSSEILIVENGLGTDGGKRLLRATVIAR